MNSGDRELAVSPRRDAAFAIVHWQYLENRGLIVLNRKQVVLWSPRGPLSVVEEIVDTVIYPSRSSFGS